MRLKSFSVIGYPPIRRFDASNLLDVVVLGGRNGVGKSRILEAVIQCFVSPHGQQSMRLLLEATSPEETQTWGQPVLDTAIAADAKKLHTHLNRIRSRANWTGSIIRFDSDRSIQQINPYSFTWDIPDPDAEHIGWNLMYGRLRDRFQDTLHAIFRRVQAQKNQIATLAQAQIREKNFNFDLSQFKDPIVKFKEAFTQLLAPKVLLDVEPKDQQLYYTEGDQRLPFQHLSSGEREAVNIVFDFILRNPSHCVVFFDEPELHLHPELSYKLLQTLRSVGASNQFVLCTHSPDIITASLDQSVIFVTPPSDDGSNQAVPVTEEDDTHQALKLLGQSVGVIALGRKIVLVEGTKTSLDKQTYGQILRAKYPGLVLVPSGGRAVLTSFDVIYEEVLGKTIWGVDFYMLCDRDSIPAARSQQIEEVAKGRLRVLPRHHLENYFLDEDVIAAAFEPLENAEHWLRQPKRVRERLREAAEKTVSYAAALATASQVREEVGNVSLLPKGCHEKSIGELKQLLVGRLKQEHGRVTASLNPDRLQSLLEDNFQRFTRIVQSDTDAWKTEIPGRPVLARFAASASIEPPRLKRMYIDQAMKTKPSVFQEIFAIFDSFAQ